MVRIASVVEESGLLSLAAANVRLGRELAHQPSIRRINCKRFFIDRFRLDHHLVPALREATKVMIDVMLYMPLIPVQMAIEGLHCQPTSYHECMRSIDIERTINALADFLWRMLAGVEMLSAEISQSPIVRQFGNVLLKLLGEF